MPHSSVVKPSPEPQPLGLADFSRAVSSSFVPLRVAAPPRQHFSGSLRAAHAGGVSVSLVSAVEHSIERTPELIARGDPGQFKLSLLLEGSGLLTQSGRSALLSPGDLALYTTDEPYSIEFEGDYRTLVVMFDHEALGLPPALLRSITAVRMASSIPLAGIMSPYLAGIAGNFGVLETRTGPRLTKTALDLVSTLFAEELGDSSSRTPKEALMARIMRFIDDHLGDPDLGPLTIANVHHISLRYLHTLFREQEKTVAGWIKQRRLERCREALTDPLLLELPVSAVASQWGFVDASHFSRSFRAEFGCSPSEMRQRS